MVRLFPGLIRFPDVAFASWDRFPQRRLTGASIPHLAPDLAIEVLSRSNTAAEMTIKVDEYFAVAKLARAWTLAVAEMTIKVDEYFAAGVQQVWLVDPKSRTVTVFAAADDCVTLSEQDVLDGGIVLPGFTFSLRELFGELDRRNAANRCQSLG